MSILPTHKPDANLHSLADQPYQCPESTGLVVLERGMVYTTDR